MKTIRCSSLPRRRRWNDKTGGYSFHPKGGTTKDRTQQTHAWYLAHREQRLEYNRRYRAEHKEQIAKSGERWRSANVKERAVYRVGYNRRYRLAHKEQHRIASREWYRAHKKSGVERAKKYRVVHSKQIAERTRKWAAAHPDKCAAYSRKYREAHPERCYAKYRAYRLSHPETVRASHMLYRARKRGNGGSYTAAEWKSACAAWGNKCLRCGATDKLTVDHVTPLVRGGRNDIKNLQLLCSSCNHKKRDKIIDYRGEPKCEV